MSKKILSIVVAITMLLSLLAPSGENLKAAVTNFAPDVYPIYFPIDCSTGTTTPGNGTPFVIHVKFDSDTPNTSYAIKSRIGPGSSLTYAISWKNETTNNWANDSTAYADLLKISTNSSGSWSGWLVAKVQNTVTPGTLNYRARMRVSPYSGSNIDSSLVSATSLNMSTQGGWVEGNATLNELPAENKVVVVKNGSTIIGIYLTENNNINEGYSLTAGYFKVGVPAGGPYTVELWDPSTNLSYLGSATVDSVTAGNVTSGVTLMTTANASPTLDWTGEAGYESDGLEPSSGNTNTDFTFRVKYTDADNDAPLSNYPKVHILKSSVEISGSPFSMTEVDPLDTTYSDGKLYTYSTKLSPGTDYTYYFEAKDSNNANATGSPTSSQTGPSVSGDGIPPVIYGVKPQRFSVTYDRTPLIFAQFSDNDSGVNSTTAYLKIDEVDHTSEASISETILSYTPSSDMSLGRHAVEVGIRDNAGNLRTLKWTFTIITELSQVNYYFGDPHSHTSYSDGALTPYDAFTYARDVANIDFLAITDHSNSLNSTEWADTLTQANNFTQNGVFVGLRGFEYTHTADGHINVYESDNYVSRNDTNYDTIPEFYAWLKTQSDNVISQFNHPFTTDDFLGFAYDTDIDGKVVLQEVGNGSPPYSYARLEESYIYALDKGWHVGATNGQDNHAANWGYPPNNLTGVIAESLTKQNIIDALKLMRTYGTEDRNLQVLFTANGYYMGSTIPADSGDTIRLSFTVNDPDTSDLITSVQIVSNGGTIVYSTSPNVQSYSGYFDFSYHGGTKWFYLKVVEQDGDVAITAPIWTPPSDIDIRATGISWSPKTVLPNKQTTLTATVANNGLYGYEDLNLSFYDGDPSSGGTLIGTNLVDLPEDSTASSSIQWIPTTSGIHYIYAVLDSPGGDEPSDNTQSVRIDVVQSIGKTVLIDRYHKNDYTSSIELSNLSEFADFLAINGYNVINTYEPITSALLTGVDLLVITYPQSGTGSRDISTAEMDVIRTFVQNGGALLFTGKSNYGEDPTRYNDFLTSMGIGAVINHDNIYDDTDNYGYQWSVNLRTFPDTPSGIGKGISNVRFFSGATLVKSDKTPIVSDPTNKIEVLAYANQTSYDEDDTPEGLTHVGAGYWIYSFRSHPEGSDMPAMGIQELPNGSRVAVLGRAIFSNYEFGYWLEGQAACNNEAFTLNLVDWLCKYDRVITIAEARKDENHDGIPDKLGQKVTIRGTVTSGTGKFFDVIYLQDETGGINVFGTIPSDKIINEGAVLQVVGVIDQYNGDTELQFTDFYRDFVWVGWTLTSEPKVFSTGALNLEENEGWLVKTQGFVTEILDSGTCKINDGSSDIIIFIDGYIGTLPTGIKVGDYLYVIGLSGEYAGGHRIRVRKPDDIQIIQYFTIISTCNTGGIIAPLGAVNVVPGGSQSFVITPNPAYYLKQVLVDGKIVFPAGMNTDVTGSYTYTFENVLNDHTIQAIFAPGFLQYVITPSSGPGGSIKPSDPVLVPQFSSQTFTITPDANYHIYDVLVDGASVKSELVDNGDGTYYYTFYNVDNNHTIGAYFQYNYFKTTAPLGDESFNSTDTLHIAWDVEGFAGDEGKVRIYFYNGQTWSIAAYNLDLADGFYDLDLSGLTIVDPFRCRVRAGIYVPDAEGSQYGPWLTWGTSKYYYDESGHFWVTEIVITP